MIVKTRKTLHPFSLGLIVLSLLVTAWFFVDRIAGLWQHPYRSAIIGWDNTFYYLWLRAPLVRGDFDFQRDLEETNTLSEPEKTVALQSPRTLTGHQPNKYPVGWALSSLPWYGVGALLTRTANLLGAHLALDGYGPYYQLALLLGQLFYAALSLGLAWWLIQQFLPGEAALIGVLSVWLGSFLFYYQTSNLSMSHNLNFLAQMGAYACSWQIGVKPQQRRYWLGLGIFCALALLARYQSAVLLIYPLWQALKTSSERRSWLNFLLTALSFLLTLIPQLLAWKVVYGFYFLYSYQNEGFDWRHFHLSEVLFSSWHGLFYWHPFLLVAAGGFFAWAWSHRNWVTGCWIASILLTTATNAAWSCWWFGSSFGLRAFDGCLFFGMVGLAYLWQHTLKRPWIRRLLMIFTCLLILWNLQLGWLARKDWLNMERPVDHLTMWRTVEAFWQGVPAREWRKNH